MRMGLRPSTLTSDRFLTISGVARAADVEGHVVRFYVRKGLIRPARVAANGYRQFIALDAKRVRFVRVAQSLGFTLGEISEILRLSRQGKTPCPRVREIILRRLAENRQRLRYLGALQDRMHRAGEKWRRMPDEVPHGDAICSLIEAVADTVPKTPKFGKTRTFGL